MKKKIQVLLILLALSCLTFAQVNIEKALKYYGEVCDTSWYYIDLDITNANNRPWPAVGSFKVEKSIYYEYSNMSGEVLQMISIDIHQAAMRYTEYYIFDVYQDLQYYLYQCEDCGSVIIKFDNYNPTIIEKSDEELLKENYFRYAEDYFTTKSIIDRSDMYIIMNGQPVYHIETDKIREKFKEINGNIDNFTVEKFDNITAYYDGEELMKIVAKEDCTKEYYLSEGYLFFAFYTDSNEHEDWRAYFCGYDAYKVIIGKKNVPKTEVELIEVSQLVREDFKEIKKIIK
ncbi:MAG: hypothetical protein C0596_10560 [Marinilabiliales bacterium]|nr:MAG: hypothetical protein C0596_10560 [Marinilabiliales bacterium]